MFLFQMEEHHHDGISETGEKQYLIDGRRD
jgi:hypothetical protein